MNIALCLSGYFGTLSENNFQTAYKGYEHIKEKLGDINNIDVFVHCWQPEFKEEIERLYKPKEIQVEKQIDFNKVCEHFGLSQKYIDENFLREHTIYKNAVIDRILSFYYSRSTSIQLMNDFSMQEEKEYDWVVSTRFDISCRGGFEVNQLKFDKNWDNQYFYAPNWNQMNCGFGDMWFVSNQDLMVKYSWIYGLALNDFKPDSDYEKLLKNWPDSQMFEANNTWDTRQFSNEILKPKEERSKNLMNYPRWCMSNSHLHHKYHFMQVGIYDKVKWV